MRMVVFLVGSLMAGAAALPGEGSVRALVAEYVAARNGKSPERVRELFTKDADQLVSTGEWRRGVEEVTQGMLASSGKEQAKSSIVITDVRLLDLDVAVVDGRYQTTALDGTVRDMWTTFVVKRTEQGWRIAAIRNMKPTAGVGKPDR